MKTEDIRNIIIRELPTVLQEDNEVQRLVLRLSKKHFADKKKTEDHVDRILDELAEDRKEQSRKWEENQKIIREVQESIKVLNRKYDSTIGAVGARWGLRTEQSFRNALKGILAEVTKLEVINVIEFDAEGLVFGRPDQIELDIVIKNGHYIVCEIKSSMSKADMLIFYKKVEFYQKRHNRQCERLLVISPMVDNRALEFARDKGIRVYSYVEDIEPNVFSTVFHPAL